MHQALEEELQRRRDFSTLINLYVDLHFAYDAKTKLRRGVIQKEISEEFGIKINNVFCQLVNGCMKKKGFIPREIQGNYYYRNIKRIK